MKVKTLPIGGVKAGPEDGLKEGEFLVYPATFTREPDSYGDVIAKGAFLDSIEAWKESGDVMPGMYLHDPNQIVAGAIDMGEDDHGWWVKGKFDDDDPHAQKVYRWLKGRRLSSLSFAYNTRDEGEVEVEDSKKANELRKLDALEFSFLPKGFAANADTSVVAVKGIVDGVIASVKAGRTFSAANEKSIDDIAEQMLAGGKELKNVLAAARGEDSKSSLPAGNDQEKASGSTEAKSEASDKEPEGVTSSVSDEEPKSSPSVEFLATQLNIYAAKVAERGSR